MKKIVGILGMAAMLGSAAFAAEPAANFVMTEFTGSMDFGWKSEFAAEKNGFYNDDSASLKFGFIDAGDKTTTGDGIWGELKIKLGDGVTIDNGVWKNGDAAITDKAYTAVVDTAKIHFVDGDFYASLNIMKPSLGYDGITPAAATGGLYTAGNINANADGSLKNGFGLNLGYKTLFDVNFKLMDNGVNVEKKFGMAIDTTVNPIDGLKLFAATAFNLDTDYVGFGTTAEYKLGLNDKMYVKPGVGFNYSKANKDAEDEMKLAAGLLFGWGAENQKPELPFVNTDSDKFNEGVSVTVSTNTKKDGLELNVGLYDQSVLSLLGDDFGTLKSGVSFTMTQATKTNKLALGAKYDVTFSPVYISLNGGMDLTMVEKAEKNPVNYSFGAQIGSKEVIDNTDVYLAYDMAGNSEADKLTTNTLKVGTKISF